MLRRQQLIAVLIVLAVAAGVLALCFASDRVRPAGRESRTRIAGGAPSAPPPPPPSAEPAPEIAPETARAINARVPFVAGPHPPAAPFHFSDRPEDLEAATVCLASAAWYEAGDDPIGQAAVVQVVLNRARHPSYPKTICGVVFQGSERTTGCQFTFTCDGALARRPSPAAWERARAVAARALGGYVFAKVSTATSYHTDWVVPYWSSSLWKLAEIHTHLFFRWPGWWGTRAAFTGRVGGPETMDRRIAWLARGSQASGEPGLLAGGEPGAAPASFMPVDVAGIGSQQLRGNVVRSASPDETQFALVLPQGGFPGDHAMAALALCRGRPSCTVAGWRSAARAPARMPVPPDMLRSASFVFRKRGGVDSALWNCRHYPRPSADQCLPGTEPDPDRNRDVPVVPAAP